jgi:HlyD family secretion protein
MARNVVRKVLPPIVLLVIIVGLAAITITNFFTRNRGPVAASGFIEARAVDVAPLVAGRVAEVYVETGSTVADGDPIALIEADTYDAAVAGAMAQHDAAADRVRAARAAYAEAERNLARVETVYEAGAVSRAELDAARTRRDVAKAELAAAEAAMKSALAGVDGAIAQHKEVRVYSPVAGTVIERYLDPGEVCGAGTPIATVADLREMDIKVYISEKYLALISVGDDVEIEIDSYPDRVFPGRVRSIADEAEFTPRNVEAKEDRVTLVFEVTVAAPNPEGRLKPGVPADVTFPKARKEELR